MTPEDASRAQSLPQLLGALPYLEAEVSKMQHAISVEAITALQKNTLTPELAQVLWVKYAAMDKLIKHFRQRIVGNQSISTQIAPMM